jgi:hypothetical protein
VTKSLAVIAAAARRRSLKSGVGRPSVGGRVLGARANGARGAPQGEASQCSDTAGNASSLGASRRGMLAAHLDKRAMT